MKAKVPIIRIGSDEPKREHWPIGCILDEDSMYNLNLAMKRALRREEREERALEISQVIVVESPTQIARIMQQPPRGQQAVVTTGGK
jgi:hypothetical protein